jgi:hypothetical protein
MSHIQEAQPLSMVMRREPPVAAAILAYPTAALIAAAFLARDADMRRNTGFLIALAALIVSVGLIVVALKSCNYVIWMGMPLVAACLPRLFAHFRLHSLGTRVFTTIMLAPAVVAAGAAAAAQAAGAELARDGDQVERGCFDSRSYAALAQLPKGLIASNVDYGPFILALTPHATVGAPYHRLSTGILAAHYIFAWPAEQARHMVEAYQVDYLVTCGSDPPAGLTMAERDASLWGRLDAGQRPDWLEKLPGEDGQAFTVYRVRGARS